MEKEETFVEAEIVNDKSIVLRDISGLKNVVSTSPIIEEYKDVLRIDINLPVEKIAENFLKIEKGYKAFRKDINLITRIRKEYTSPALEYQKSCIAIEKDVVSILEPYSLILKALKDKVENEEARKQAKAEALEEQRVEAIQRKISTMERLPLEMMQKTSSELREFLSAFSVPTEKEYEEFYEKALLLHSQVQTQLTQMAEQKELVENAQAIQDEKDAESNRLKDEEDAKHQAKKDKLAQEQAKFQKQKDEFEAMQREQQEILDRREADRVADELQAKQEEEKADRDKQFKERKRSAYSHAVEDMEKVWHDDGMDNFSQMVDAIQAGKIRHIKWED